MRVVYVGNGVCDFDAVRYMEKLLALSKRILHEVESLEEDAMEYVENRGHEMIVFFQFFYSQFSSMGSVLLLLKESKYKDCFIILRSIFESYLFLLQMIKGKVYKVSREYAIIPNPGNTKKDARDKTLENWKGEWKKGEKPEYKDIVGIDPKGEDKIIVTYKWEGLYEEKDINHKGYWISRYFFAFEEYSPELRFLSHLPTIAAGDWMHDVTLRLQEEHKEIYHHAFYFNSIIENLKGNELINDEQKDRILVHYNFLSSFTHPTRNMIDSFGDPRVVYIKGYENKIIVDREKGTVTRNNAYSKHETKIIEEQILLYICKLQMLFISLILEFFVKLSSNSDWSKKYFALVKQLEEATKDFWFIFEEPTEFDIKESKMQKMWAKGREKEVPKDIVIYYKNPLERLKKLKSYKRT